MKMLLQTRRAMSQDLQLICKCCGQPYQPAKCWHDQLDAVIQGQEKFAICPICTQARHHMYSKVQGTGTDASPK